MVHAIYLQGWHSILVRLSTMVDCLGVLLVVHLNCCQALNGSMHTLCTKVAGGSMASFDPS